jgi:hypothetical protein
MTGNQAQNENNKKKGGWEKLYTTSMQVHSQLASPGIQVFKNNYIANSRKLDTRTRRCPGDVQ